MSPSKDNGGACKITLWHGDNGEPIAETVTPLPDLRALYTACRKFFPEKTQAPPPPGEVEALGRELASLLLPEPIRLHLYARLLSAPLSASVRLRLDLSTEPLADLPWELLYLDAPPPRERQGGFLCRFDRFHLVRHTPGTAASPPEQIEGGLRVLVAWANPALPEYSFLPYLDAEIRAVRAALQAPACWNVEVRELPNATRSQLEQSLQEWRPHVFYFSGHGDDREGGVLILHPEERRVEPILRGKDLASWLATLPTRLVVLSACDTAGIARVLARQGVPAVVAMQLPLRTAAAEAFTRNFFSVLAQPASVEQALQIARLQMGGETRPDWGVPTLTLSGKTSELFLAASQPIPTNLKTPPLRHFKGRAESLTTIERAFGELGERYVALVGMGGLGKSTLALEYAHRAMSRYPEGVYWIDTQDRDALRHSLAEIGRLYFHVSHELPIKDQSALTLRRFNELSRPALFIYDNLHQEEDLEMLPAMGASHVLVTTRYNWIKRRCYTIAPPLLSEEAALELLLAHAPPRDEADREAARRLAAGRDRLPLALTLISRYVAQCGIGYADYPGREPRNVRKQLAEVIRFSYDRLEPLPTTILGQASCFAPRSISPDLLHAAYQEANGPTEPEDFHLALGVLDDFSLVRREELLEGERQRRLMLHDVVRDFARERMTAPQRRTALTASARALSRRLHEANERMEWGTAHREIEHGRVVKNALQEEAEGEELTDLLREIGSFYLLHEETAAAEECLTQALQRVERVHGRQNREAALLLMRLSIARQKRFDHTTARAMALEALAIAEAVYAPDDAEMAEYHDGLGTVLTWQGLLGRPEDLERADLSYHRALEIGERSLGRQHPHVVRYLHNLGMLYFEQKRSEEALTYLQQALDINQEMNGSRHVTVAMGHLTVGKALAQQSRWTEALDRYLRALEIFQEVYEGRLNPNIAFCLYHISKAEQALSRSDQARNQLTEALSIYERCYGPEHHYCGVIRKTIEELA